MGDQGLPSVPTLALQFFRALKSLRQHQAKESKHLQLLCSRLSSDKGFSSPSKPMFGTFLKKTVKACILNLESPPSRSISINTVYLVLYFIHHTSHIKIHSHTCSPDFCLNELANPLSSLGVLHTSSWTSLFISSLGACVALSLVIRLEATIGGLWGTLVLSCLASASEKVTADLADDGGLFISLV